MKSNFPGMYDYKVHKDRYTRTVLIFPTGYKDFVRNTPSSVIDQVWLILYYSSIYSKFIVAMFIYSIGVCMHVQLMNSSCDEMCILINAYLDG